MITGYQKALWPDINGKNSITVEVNWSEDESVKECKLVRLTFQNGQEAYLKREDLNSFLFAIGTHEDQTRMIPQSLQTVHWRETTLGIKATKDIHKGEMLNFPLKISFPCDITRQIVGKVKGETVRDISGSYNTLAVKKK